MDVTKVLALSLAVATGTSAFAVPRPWIHEDAPTYLAAYRANHKSLSAREPADIGTADSQKHRIYTHGKHPYPHDGQDSANHHKLSARESLWVGHTETSNHYVDTHGKHPDTHDEHPETHIMRRSRCAADDRGNPEDCRNLCERRVGLFPYLAGWFLCSVRCGGDPNTPPCPPIA